MTAAADGHMDIVKMLLQHNANVTLKDAQGWKAADHAVMNGIHRYSWYYNTWMNSLCNLMYPPYPYKSTSDPMHIVVHP